MTCESNVLKSKKKYCLLSRESASVPRDQSSKRQKDDEANRAKERMFLELLVYDGELSCVKGMNDGRRHLGRHGEEKGGEQRRVSVRGMSAGGLYMS